MNPSPSSTRSPLAAELLADRTRHARAWKAAGKPVVGFLSNSVPVELIDAAGCFPLQLPALPSASTPLADRYMEDLFDPMARSVFERLLAGEFAFVDLVVLPRAVDSFQRMYYYLCELQRLGLERAPAVFLYDVLQTPTYSSAEYSYARTLDLKRRLEALAQRSISDADLHASIGSYDAVRRRLAGAFEQRCAAPCAIAGETVMDLLTVSQIVAPRTIEATLDALLAADTAPAGGKRVVLVGSAHDEPLLHARIAAAGGQVVGDYHWRGELLWGPELDRTLPPLRALATHYQRDVRGARTFPVPIAEFGEFVRARRADAALFYYYEQEEALTWDHVEQRQALDALGVPWLCLSMQPYPAGPAVDAQLREFLAGITERHS